MTAKTTTSGASRTTAKSQTDAITLLSEDHKEVKKLFKAFEKLVGSDDSEKKQELAEQICHALTIHAEIEEEIFYPAARASIDDDDLLNEAEVEHASAKDLITQLQAMSPSDEMFDAKVTVLGEYIDHHVQEEENEMFPKVKKAKLNLADLGEQMSARKAKLTETLGVGISAGSLAGRSKSASAGKSARG